MSPTQSKYGRRFDEEFKREVAALASRPAVRRQEQVARDLGVSPWSGLRWKRPDGFPAGAAATSPTCATSANPQELERQNRSLRRENEALRTQREILKKALAILSEAPRGGMA